MEISGFWTTDVATPEGDQVAGYNQAHWTYATSILAACNGYEGVAPGRLSELAGTVTGANTVAINNGVALVDGKWFSNDASQNVNIPSAGSGKTRIDRIVLRADWAGFNVSVYRIEGTESSGTPAAPAITQTSGTTYDITLYQALVNSSGTVTLTDERVWATPHTDESTLTTSAGNLKIKDDGVDSAQIAAGAVDLEHMSANSVDSDQYVDGSIDTAHIAAGAIDHPLMANNAIEEHNIKNLEITNAKLSVDSVTGSKIADNTIDSQHYVHGSIDHEHLADTIIETSNIVNNAVTSDKLGTLSVTAGKVDANAVDSANYVDGSIDQEHLSVGASKFTNRQGGNADSWGIGGVDNYAPTTARMQGGASTSSAGGDVTITYPVAFSNAPLLYVFAIGATVPHYIECGQFNNCFLVSVRNAAGARIAVAINWFAFGPV